MSEPFLRALGIIDPNTPAWVMRRRRDSTSPQALDQQLLLRKLERDLQKRIRGCYLATHPHLGVQPRPSLIPDLVESLKPPQRSPDGPPPRIPPTPKP